MSGNERVPRGVSLKSHLRRWGLRLRLAESLTWGPWGGAAGLGAGLLLAL
ncbi:MAG: hypothetical protein GY832_13765, partial [Chloroflexi bacterium]|nr:hypothetical protein [Chloroflexota bacterium]